MAEITAEQIEAHNVETFERYGTDMSSQPRHICVKCKNPVSINCSISNKGHRLICNSCARRIFGTELSALDWVYNYGIKESEEDG